MLNGMTFILVGLELPDILDGIRAEGVSLMEATWYGLITTGALIIVRFISVFGAIVVTQIMKHFITVADENIPDWRIPLLLGWAGMRGAVSLAAALSIPLMAGDAPFPHRSLIIYMTFVVIFFTLVVQGLSLPILVKRLRPEDPGDYISDEETEKLLQTELARTALSYVKKHYPEAYEESPALRHQVKQWRVTLETEASPMTSDYLKIYLEVLEHQRTALLALNKRPDINEEVIRRYLLQLDLEETKWN